MRPTVENQDGWGLGMTQDDRAPRPEARLSPPLRIALILAGAAYLAVSAWLAWRTPVLAPYADMLDWVARWLDFRSHGDLGAYLLAPHVSHRLVFTFLILWADIAAFGARGWLFVVTGVGLLALTAGLLAGAARQAVGGEPGRVVGGAAAALVLMSPNILDATLHIYTVYIEALVLAVAAILLATPADGAPPGRWRLATALLCAAAAAFGNAVALAVWPVLAFGARREGWRRPTLILLLGALLSLAYFSGGTAGPTLRPAPGSAVADLPGAALMFLSYLGLPWTRAVPGLGWLAGLALAGASVWAIARRGGPGANRAERVAVQLILFSLLTAFMAAVGRQGTEPPTGVPLRYAVLLAPLHVGLLILAAPWLARTVAARPRLGAWALTATALLLVVHQVGSGLFVVRTADINRGWIAAFKAGDRSPQVVQGVHPDPVRAQAILARMRAEGIYQDEPGPPPAPRTR